MKGISTILSRFAYSRPSSVIGARSSSRKETLILSSAVVTASFSTLILSDEVRRPLFNSVVAPTVSAISQSILRFNHSRSFSSGSSSGPSKVISIESEEQFNDALLKAQDESSPSMFYFTAAWCGPCRIMSPLVAQMSEKYPHVKTYKIDIDKEDLAKTINKLDIRAVPTIHFYRRGKKAYEIVGADNSGVTSTMEDLYSK